MHNHNHRSLLGADEPEAFSLLNEYGSAPLLITCDHASNRIPASLDGLGIDPRLLEKHIGYDIGALQLGRLLMERFDAPLLVANYSRLVIDLNRHFNDPTLIPEVSDDHVIPGNRGLDEDQRAQRINELFTPYHDTYHNLVADLKARCNRPLVLSVHSFTPFFQGRARPWQFGVLWDQDKILAGQLIQNLRQVSQSHTPALKIGDNKPYHARFPLGYGMVQHTEKLGVEMALIETRQDLIIEEAGQQWAADILYQALNPLLDHSRVCKTG